MSVRKTFLRATALVGLSVTALTWNVGPARASGNSPSAGSTQNMTVSMTVVPTCVFTTTALSFGNSVTAPSVGDSSNTNGALNVTCTQGVTYSIDISHGANDNSGLYMLGQTAVGGDYTTANTSTKFGYSLYYDSDLAASHLWGTGYSGSAYTGYSGSSNSTAIPVYGKLTSIPATLLAGSYQDTVTFTITY